MTRICREERISLSGSARSRLSKSRECLFSLMETTRHVNFYPYAKFLDQLDLRFEGYDSEYDSDFDSDDDD